MRWKTGSEVALPSPCVKKAGTSTTLPIPAGGVANMGITLATYREWSDAPHLGDLQVKDLTLKTARAIYRSHFWNLLRAAAHLPGVDLSVFDMGVNAGIWRSARLLQRALGFTGEEVDCSIGPETLAAADRFDARTLVNAWPTAPSWSNARGDVGNKHPRPLSGPTMTKSAGSVRAISAASTSTRAAISPTQ